MKYKIYVVLACVVVSIAIFCGLKAILLLNYKVELKEETIKALDTSKGTIKIKTDDDITDTLVEFKDLSYVSLGDSFVFDEKTSSTDKNNLYNSYFLRDDNPDNFIALFRVGKGLSAYDMLTSDSVTTFGFSFKGTNKKELLENFNLKDDNDIYKYIIDHYKDKVSIFSSRDEIRMNYLIKTFINVVVPVSKITLISGDLQGYMYTLGENMITEVHLIHNKENYVLAFFNSRENNYFNINDIKDFLTKVYFK